MGKATPKAESGKPRKPSGRCKVNHLRFTTFVPWAVPRHSGGLIAATLRQSVGGKIAVAGLYPVYPVALRMLGEA